MSYDIVPTARWAPGKCIITGDTQGPFLDTKRRIPRYGAVYISVKAIHQLAEEFGFATGEQVEEMRELIGLQTETIKELSKVKDSFNDLVEAVSEYLPTPEPEIVEKQVTTVREPTDEEIEVWIQTRGGNNPVVQSARTLEKGSSEEWQALYGNKPKAVVAPKVEEEEEVPTLDEGPPSTYSIFDQEVDLDAVLKQSIKDVLSYAEGKDDEFIAALVRREFFLTKDDPRKGLLTELGYWDEETDGPLEPADEEEDENDENDEDNE